MAPRSFSNVAGLLREAVVKSGGSLRMISPGLTVCVATRPLPLPGIGCMVYGVSVPIEPMLGDFELFRLFFDSDGLPRFTNDQRIQPTWLYRLTKTVVIIFSGTFAGFTLWPLCMWVQLRGDHDPRLRRIQRCNATHKDCYTFAACGRQFLLMFHIIFREFWVHTNVLSNDVSEL